MFCMFLLFNGVRKNKRLLGHSAAEICMKFNFFTDLGYCYLGNSQGSVRDIQYSIQVLPAQFIFNLDVNNLKDKIC